MPRIITALRLTARSLPVLRDALDLLRQRDAPGAVDTPMLRSGLTDTDLAATVGAIPLGRLALPAEVAGPVLFLLSDQASYVSGATLNVSGAWLMY